MIVRARSIPQPAGVLKEPAAMLKKRKLVSMGAGMPPQQYATLSAVEMPHEEKVPAATAW